jgi:hypothetical protein
MTTVRKTYGGNGAFLWNDKHPVVSMNLAVPMGSVPKRCEDLAELVPNSREHLH